jgi:hypothetical protein
VLETGYYFCKDEAESFVRDAMLFTGVSAKADRKRRAFEFTRGAARRLRRLLVGRRRRNENDDPYSYVGAPLKPKTPYLKSAVPLPLP